MAPERMSEDGDGGAARQGFGEERRSSPECPSEAGSATHGRRMVGVEEEAVRSSAP